MKKILSLALALALVLAGANRVLIIFSDDMCVGENTSRLAAAFSNESPTKWVSFESLSKNFFDKLKRRE